MFGHMTLIGYRNCLLACVLWKKSANSYMDSSDQFISLLQPGADPTQKVKQMFLQMLCVFSVSALKKTKGKICEFMRLLSNIFRCLGVCLG